MCLGFPGQVVSVRKNKAKVKTSAHCHWVDTSALELPVKVGDYLISYQNVAINKVTPGEAQEILKLLKE
jgi:hydrogenase assembly chaperone HypC/HupF